METFTKVGSGPPLIVVDGAFCYRGFGPSAALADALSGRFTVTTYDRRGRGGSPGPAPSLAEEIADLKALGTGAAPVLVGISSGGALALHAVAQGMPAAKLVLYEPPFVAGLDFAALRRELEAVASPSGKVRFFLRRVMGVPALFTLFVSRKMKAVAHTLPVDLALMADTSVLSARLQTPALVVAGEKSPKLLRDAVERVAAALPHGQARSIAGATHDVPTARLAELCS